MPGIKGEFIPRPKLAQSSAHHKAMGSSRRNRPDIPENWHRPQHEFMSDGELQVEIINDINIVREEYVNIEVEAKGERGKQFMQMYRMIYGGLMLDLRYLDVIGRLPKDIDVDMLEVELAIPEGIE